MLVQILFPKSAVQRKNQIYNQLNWQRGDQQELEEFKAELG